MENIELDVGGTKFKGVWIAILFSFASTIGGGIWTASEFFNRIEAQEQAVQEALGIRGDFDVTQKQLNKAISDFNTQILTMQQRLDDNDVSGLQGKLATLGTNLEQIMQRQSELLALQEKVSELQTTVAERGARTDSQLEKLPQYDSDMDRIKREIEDLWNGMDALSNPLQ
jgi:chromosome segregation ATPase